MKNPDVYLRHVLECIDAILLDYYSGLSEPKELFLRDDKTRQATLHRLQTMGQSVKNLPADIQMYVSATTDWRAIAGFRDVLVHDYLGVDLDIVWNVVENELPALQKEVRTYLEKKYGKF